MGNMTENQLTAIREAMEKRHSVRHFTKEPIRTQDADQLMDLIRECNEQSGLHIQLVMDDKNAFNTLMTRYGWFQNVNNYVALVGRDDETLEEKCGYYGEKIVLFAQSIGLSTCWVGGTFSRKNTRFQADEGEKLCLVIAIGYAAKDGKPHKNKAVTRLSNLTDATPDWFKKGMEAVMLAPTALNQQKFRFELLENGKVRAIPGGPYGKVDLGIVKYHFEIGSGRNREDLYE